MPDIDKNEIIKLEEFALQCTRVRSNIFLGTHSLTPINYQQEKEKFFTSSTYNPQFKYNHHAPDIDEEIDKLGEILTSIDIPQDFRLYLEHYLIDMRNCALAVRAIGTTEFADHAARIFALDSPKIQKYLNMSPEITISMEEKDRLHTAEEIAQIFRHTLKNKYNITHYDVTIDRFNDHTVRVGNRKIILGEKIKRFRKSIDRLIIHEIESHVLQRINSEHSRILQLTPLGDRTLYSEGLAVYNEVASEKITLTMYKLYSHRLTAVRLLELSFREIYEELTGKMPDNIAYQITYRVKRGLSDTRNPGGYPKDAFYLLGYMAVNDRIVSGHNARDFYTARTPELLTFVKKYKLVDIQAPRILPTFLNENKYTNPHTTAMPPTV